MSPFTRLAASASSSNIQPSLSAAPSAAGASGASGISVDVGHRPLRRFAFTIRAAAEAETVPRLISPFAKRGIVPLRFSSRSGHEQGWLSVWVEVELGDAAAADIIASGLRTIMCVDAVLVEETRQVLPRHERTFGAFAAG